MTKEFEQGGMEVLAPEKSVYLLRLNDVGDPVIWIEARSVEEARRILLELLPARLVREAVLETLATCDMDQNAGA